MSIRSFLVSMAYQDHELHDDGNTDHRPCPYPVVALMHCCHFHHSHPVKRIASPSGKQEYLVDITFIHNIPFHLPLSSSVMADRQSFHQMSPQKQYIFPSRSA
jgi:hypothetical protein